MLEKWSNNWLNSDRTLAQQVEKMVSQVQRKAKILQRGAINTVKNHPIPVVLIGIGIGWMLLDDNDSHNREYDFYRDRSLTTEDRIGHYGRGEGRHWDSEPARNVTVRRNDAADAILEWAGDQVGSVRRKVVRVVDRVS